MSGANGTRLRWFAGSMARPWGERRDGNQGSGPSPAPLFCQKPGDPRSQPCLRARDPAPTDSTSPSAPAQEENRARSRRGRPSLSRSTTRRRRPRRAGRGPGRRPLPDPVLPGVPVRVRVAVGREAGRLQRRGALRRSPGERAARRPARAGGVRRMAPRAARRAASSSPSAGWRGTATASGRTTAASSGPVTTGRSSCSVPRATSPPSSRRRRRSPSRRRCTGCWPRTRRTWSGAPTSTPLVEWVSPSVTSVLGWTPAEMVGTRILDHVHPDDLDRVRTATAAANDGGRVSFEARYLCKDDTYRWLEITARPLLDESGEVIGKVGSCRDVHSEIEAWHALERSEERFRLAMASARRAWPSSTWTLASSRSTPSCAGCSATGRSGCSSTTCRPSSTPRTRRSAGRCGTTSSPAARRR